MTNGNGKRSIYPAGGGELIPVQKGEHRGRKPGTPNKVSKLLKDAVLLAAEEVGYITYKHDKKGKLVLSATGVDGLVGYLKYLAINEPRSFAILLGRVLPMQVAVRDTGTSPDVVYKTVEEVRAEMREKGIPIDKFFN